MHSFAGLVNNHSVSSLFKVLCQKLYKDALIFQTRWGNLAELQTWYQSSGEKSSDVIGDSWTLGREITPSLLNEEITAEKRRALIGMLLLRAKRGSREETGLQMLIS